jgi:hypothetical protein
MGLKVSTGLREYMLATGSLKDALDGGEIRIFDGVPPATADEAETGTLLVTISLNSTGSGISFESTPDNAVLVKASAEIWSGVNVASGTATYYRHVQIADDGSEDSSAPRIQGTVGIAGADMNLSSTTLTESATQTLDYYSVAFPTL